MTFAGDDLVSFTVDQATAQRSVDENGVQMADGVKNTGSIVANGGQITVKAAAAQDVLDHVINMDGIVQANSVSQQNGEIVFAADNTTPNVVRVAGKISATGTSSGQTGGSVTVTGYNILLDQDLNIDVSGDAGGGNVNIGGNLHGIGPLANAHAVVMLAGSSILANALTSGNGGTSCLMSENATGVDGIISATGGNSSGNGGFVETSSHGDLQHW